MTLYNENLYNTSQYNEYDIIPLKYDSADYGADFGDGFKIPNVFVFFCDIKYLDPLGSEYSTPRVTQVESRHVNIQKTEKIIYISGYITGTSRKDLIEKVEYFKAKTDGLRLLKFKDAGVEKQVKAFVKSKFDEQKFSVTRMKFELECQALDYIALANTKTIEKQNITANNERLQFYNNGEETDLLAVLQINSIDTTNITLSINGIDLIVPNVETGDTITIDTDRFEVIKGGESLVFGGIISKLKAGDNEIIIKDNAGQRDYSINIYYNITLK